MVAMSAAQKAWATRRANAAQGLAPVARAAKPARPEAAAAIVPGAILTADQWPTTSITVGLGRSFAWNHWARVNGVTDQAGRVRRDRLAHFRAVADAQHQTDNAFDRRACA